MVYRFFYIFIFILVLILFFYQCSYIFEFNFYIKKVKKIILNKNFSKKDDLKLKYNYNLARAKYIYEICFFSILKIYFKKYKDLDYLEI